MWGNSCKIKKYFLPLIINLTSATECLDMNHGREKTHRFLTTVRITLCYIVLAFNTLQMKGRWESNINAWFPFMYSQIWNCAVSLFPKQNYNALFPNSYTLIYVRDLYIARITVVCLFCCSQIFGHVEIGTEAAQFPEKEYINGIFVAVQYAECYLW